MFKSQTTLKTILHQNATYLPLKEFHFFFKIQIIWTKKHPSLVSSWTTHCNAMYLCLVMIIYCSFLFHGFFIVLSHKVNLLQTLILRDMYNLHCLFLIYQMKIHSCLQKDHTLWMNQMRYCKCYNQSLQVWFSISKSIAIPYKNQIIQVT